jgi:muramoyltetrapeptide carboxypeptidase
MIFYVGLLVRIPIMITPPYLKPGDKIGIVAPARSIDKDEIEHIVDLFKNHGFDVETGKNLFGKINQFSGTDKERANDIQQFLDNPNIKAIICARGGYGSIRTIDFLSFEKFIKQPKWFIGFSDITVFHSVINNLGIETLHAPMPFSFNKPEFDKGIFNDMLSILQGKRISYTFPSHPLNSQGKAKGCLTGGNLSVLYSLRGTNADLKTHGKILFIEDIDEYLYHIDRMMMNFHFGGLLSQLRAIIVGDMTDMKDNTIPFGKNAFEIIAEHSKELCIPICYGFPAGHGKINRPLIMGREIVLEIGPTCHLSFKM